MKTIRRVRLVMTRIVTLTHIFFSFLFSNAPLSFKVAFFASILTGGIGRGQVSWVGGTFASDNKLGLLLLPHYWSELRSVSQFVGSDLQRVVDIGANVGQFAVTCLAMNPSASIVCFEPNPMILQLLRENLQRFGDRCLVIPHGVAQELTEIDLHFVEGKSAQGSLIEANADLGLMPGQTVRRVKVQTGPVSVAAASGWLWDSPEVDLLKIDVEGSELDALAGSAGLRPKYVMAECVSRREGGLTSHEASCAVEETFGEPTLAEHSHRGNVLFQLR